MNEKSVAAETLADVCQKLAFQRGVLTLLKETNLFGPLIDKALEDMDSVLDRICR